MEYIIICSFILSAILAYFLNKIKIKYSIYIIINIVLLTLLFLLLCFTGVKGTSLLLFFLIVLMTVIGIISHYVFPVVLNAVTFVVAKITKESYQRVDYNALLKDGHKMYFAILLFNTIKNELIILFSCSELNLLK